MPASAVATGMSVCGRASSSITRSSAASVTAVSMPNGPTCGPAELRHMSEAAELRTQIARDGPDVSALAAFHLENGAITRPSRSTSVSSSICTSRGSSSTDLAAARQIVGPLAMYLHRGIAAAAAASPCRRTAAAPLRCSTSDGRRSLLPMTAPSASSVSRASPKRIVKSIRLAAVHHVGNGLGGLAQRDRQHAGRQRIERAAMPDLLRAGEAPDRADHLGRSRSLALVDDQPAVQRSPSTCGPSHPRSLPRPAAPSPSPRSTNAPCGPPHRTNWSATNRSRGAFRGSSTAPRDCRATAPHARSAAKVSGASWAPSSAA